MGHKQLTYEDRVVIYRLWKLGVPQASIGREMGVNRSSICRELGWLAIGDKNRDSYELARIAHNAASKRKSEGRSRSRKIPEHLWQKVEIKLRDERWSPENISLWLKQELPSHYISHRAIYDYINNSHPEWKQYLRRKGKRPRYGHPTHRKIKRPQAAAQKKSIRERPDIVNKRKQVGHWEVDLVGSTSRSTILILVERLMRFSILVKVPNKLSSTIKQAIFDALSPLPQNLRRSLTYDNGPENALHYQLDSELGSSSFFCEPYHSWEKGTVENRIGIVRIFFPKGTNFDTVSQDQINKVAFLLNNRPLKILGSLFPATLFNDCLYTEKYRKVA